jgi:hypothetical protein
MFEGWVGEASGLEIVVGIWPRLMELNAERSIYATNSFKREASIITPEISLVLRLVDITCI